MAGAVFCVLLLCAVASAHARAATGCSSNSSSSIGLPGSAKIISETDVPLCATGQAEVSFRSDAVTPCGCGYVGTDTWQPQGGGDLDVLEYRRGGRREFDTTLLLGGAVSVRDAVQRTQTTGQVSACSDTNDDSGFGGFVSPPVHAGRLVVSLVQSGASLIDTRCAGPLPVDVGTGLPTASISLSRIIRGGGLIDLRGSHSFAAHGFSGVVRSTLVLRLGRARANHPSQPVPAPSAPGLGAHGNPAAIGVDGGGEMSLHGTVAADLSQDGECRDHTRLSAASVQVQSHAGHVLISLSPVSTQATDPLRTRCPGPELGQHALALATLTHSALRGRMVTVALHGNSFSDGPYRVRTGSTLVLTLRRVRVA